MTVLDFMLSPVGQQLTQGIVLLLVALSAYFSAKARQQAAENAKKLDGHLDEHILELSHTTGGVTEHPSHDM